MADTNGFAGVINDSSSLKLFLKKMSEFDQAFCDHMVAGGDFNLRLEVRGDKGKLIHCRLSRDETDRPDTKPSKKSDD